MGLFHITPRAAWEEALSLRSYRPASLDREGFIHLSYDGQWLVAGNRFYRGQPELVLLALQAERLTAEVKEEAADGDRYPHLYGPLNVEAVANVYPLGFDDVGLCAVPAELVPWRHLFLPPPHRLPTPPGLEALLKTADAAVEQVALVVVRERGKFAPFVCVETKPGQEGAASLKALRGAATQRPVDPLLSRCGWLQLPRFPREASGAVDGVALALWVQHAAASD